MDTLARLRLARNLHSRWRLSEEVCDSQHPFLKQPPHHHVTTQMSENPYYGGGGYVPGGSQYNSPGGAARRSTVQALRPLTIKQIHSASQAHTDAEWMLDNTEIGQVTVVALVMTIQRQTTNSIYLLDDGTSRIEARHWADAPTDEDGDANTITENVYVRVMGGIKSFGAKRYINATHLRRSTDPHEIYFHALECVSAKLLLERGPPGGGSGDVKLAAPGSLNITSAYSAQPHQVSTDQFAYLPPLERSIATFMLNQPPNEEGIHVGAIARAVSGTAAAISAALDKLMDEGHVYTTIDESHYALSV